MKIKPPQLIGPVIAIALFSLALRVLYHELAKFHYHEVVDKFSSLPLDNVLTAGFFTLASYLVLTMYDVLAMRYVGQRLPYYKVAMASFIGYTLSHNLGFPLFTGGAARYRLFSAWGLSNLQIAKAIAFSGIVFWVGFTLLGGAVLVIDPPPVPEGFNLAYASLRPVGVTCLIAVCLCFFFFCVKKRPFRVKDWEFPAPAPALSLAGMVIASIDWILAANVAWYLLPRTELSYLEFLGLFQLGQIAGLLSHVPGGLGVFEATILAFLSDQVPPSALFGSLLAYRVVYYLVPLALSSILLIAHESVNHRAAVLRIAGDALRRMEIAVPSLFAICLFACGAGLLFSGAVPPVEFRFLWLKEYFPLYVIETSHLTASLAGIGLIFLAHGIRRKLYSAWSLSSFLLAIGAISSMLKGWDYEETSILGIMLLLLILGRGHFYRRSPLFMQASEPAWLMAVAFVFVTAIWLISFAFKHIEYAHSQISYYFHTLQSIYFRMKISDLYPAPPEIVCKAFGHLFSQRRNKHTLALFRDLVYFTNEMVDLILARMCFYYRIKQPCGTDDLFCRYPSGLFLFVFGRSCTDVNDLFHE